MAVASWQLVDNHHAQLTGDSLTAQVDAHAPQQGLDQLAVGGQSLGGHLLAVRFLPEGGRTNAVLAESYVRGDDLVATYVPVDERPYRPQLYWRLQPTIGELPAVAAIDLMVSIQTNRLDSHPQMLVTSGVTAAEVWHLSAAGEAVPIDLSSGSAVSLSPDNGDGCVLLRTTTGDGSQISYAEMIHPSDFANLVVRRADCGEIQIEHRLFASFLEKGVIRRARLRGVLLEREGDVEAAAAWYQALVSDHLPLTT